MFVNKYLPYEGRLDPSQLTLRLRRISHPFQPLPGTSCKARPRCLTTPTPYPTPNPTSNHTPNPITSPTPNPNNGCKEENEGAQIAVLSR